MNASDLLARLEDMQRRLAVLENLTTARAPMAIAGQNFASQVVLTGVAFSLGDVVKCVAGLWSEHTSADLGALMVGVVSQQSGTTCTVTMAGERSDASAAGVVGTLYWTPDVAGGAYPAASMVGMQRVIEMQISPTVRLVLPDPLSWFAVTIQTCDAGVLTDHDAAWYLNKT
jgi:hypothetical protein